MVKTRQTLIDTDTGIKYTSYRPEIVEAYADIQHNITNIADYIGQDPRAMNVNLMLSDVTSAFDDVLNDMNEGISEAEFKLAQCERQRQERIKNYDKCIELGFKTTISTEPILNTFKRVSKDCITQT